MDKIETDEEIRVTVPENGWCRYCRLIDEETGEALPTAAHDHVWKKPKRCEQTLSADSWEPSEHLQCQRDEGHDRGEFPRYAWDHGLDNIAKIIMNPTPHLVEWEA